MDWDDSNCTNLKRKERWGAYFDRCYGASGVEKLASMYRNGQHCRCLGRINGGFNVCFKILFDDGTVWAVRFPVPGWVMHPEEKVRREVAVLTFIQQKTRIPVPKLIAHGSSSDNHDPEIGSFIISEWVEGVSLESFLEELPRPEWGPVLRDGIGDDLLYDVYRQVSNILLELASHDFNKIGSLELSQTDDQTWSITTRPLTLKMNEIESHGYVTADDHTAPPFDSSKTYMENVLEQNMPHLYKQRNAVDSRKDARRKYILRRRMQAFVPYFTSDLDCGPFTLHCDDLCPRNILIDEKSHRIAAVIDWEWTYPGPCEFSYTPPSWLILEDINIWIDSSEKKYKEKLQLFLKAMADAEDEILREKPFEKTPRLSTAMRRSFEDGTFWFVQLSKSCFNFDGEVMWPNLEAILRKRQLLEVGMPDEEEVEEFVALKMKHLDAYNKEMRRSSAKKQDEQEEKPDSGSNDSVTDLLVESSKDSTIEANDRPSNQPTVPPESVHEQFHARENIHTSENQIVERERDRGVDRQRSWLETAAPSCIFN